MSKIEEIEKLIESNKIPIATTGGYAIYKFRSLAPQIPLSDLEALLKLAKAVHLTLDECPSEVNSAFRELDSDTYEQFWSKYP